MYISEWLKKTYTHFYNNLKQHVFNIIYLECHSEVRVLYHSEGFWYVLLGTPAPLYFNKILGLSVTCSYEYQNIGTVANRAARGSIASSTLGDIPANLLGSGPIILTNWGTSRLPMEQNLPRAFIQRNTCSSGGLPWKYKLSFNNNLTRGNIGQRQNPSKKYGSLFTRQDFDHMFALEHWHHISLIMLSLYS